MAENTEKDRKGKSIFQRELERTTSRRIAVTIVVGCLFFCVGIVSTNMIHQQINRKRHLNDLAATFYTIYQSTEDFLMDAENVADYKSCMKEGEEKDAIRYSMSKYNVEAPVSINMIITNEHGEICFSSFSEDSMNLHRLAFNRIAGENAHNDSSSIYTTVYYFTGNTSEYVMVEPIYEENQYLGSVAVYLKGSELGNLFTKHQYDAIITNRNHDIIFCSNADFLKERNANKFILQKNTNYLEVNNERYLIGKRYLSDKQITIYSFIYSPKNYLYVLIGVGTILILGLIWTIMFLRMLRYMAGKTSESVETLVNEIRIIRKKDANHVITIQTGDEIEEIAQQINKMIKSIHELNNKNVELAKVNSQMELQNLQAQMNPHFIYNTLDNIKYLIVPDPARAEELIERFTHILRYSINNTKRNVFLQEDMTYLEDYLIIQQTRFGKRFEYEIDIEKKCLDLRVPKLLLQPLLENSIKYGFKKKTEISVKITGTYENDYVYLTVWDNGAGQPKPTLEVLRGMIQTEDIDTTHNGLQNINRRIVLEYGEDSGMKLDSVEGEEFVVTLKLWAGEKQNV